MGVPQPRMHSEPPPVPGARWVPLTRGLFALVDEADFAWVSQWTWCVQRSWKNYAVRRNGRRVSGTYKVRMHRDLLGAAAGQVVDHINGDGLDNRRANLRF